MYTRTLTRFALSFAFALLIVPSVSLAATTITHDLSVGSTGSDVTTLQTFLSTDASIYPEGLVTGYYGQLTANAVTRFQARYGIDQVGVVGPLTRTKVNELLVYGGFGTGGSVTTYGDVSAPIMTPQNVSATSNSATISWTTSEPAQNRVMYSTVWPFLYATAPSVSAAAQFDTSPTVTLSGLQSNTRYYFVPESVDANGNIMYTTAQWFTTAQ